MKFNDLFKNKAIIGMVHLLPLPSSPNFNGDIESIEKRAIEDTKALIKGGVDALIVENFEDTPYQETISLEAYSTMLKIAQKVKKISTVPVGVNVQFNGVKQEWALAYTIGADFLRAETFVETRVGVHGISYPSAPTIMRQKQMFPCECMIFADINVKHTNGLVNIKMEDAAKDAIESNANAIIVTGKETGCNPQIEDLIELRKKVKDFPILVGSGINENNIKDFLQYADGVIVGSSIKKEKNVHLGIDEDAVKELVRIARS